MIGDVGSFTLAHLPIVKAYAWRMGFVEIIDRALPGGMHASPGKVLLGLVMNVLCSRSPLYRVEEFFRIRDVGLILGEDMTAEILNDDAIGRVLDRMYEYGCHAGILDGNAADKKTNGKTLAELPRIMARHGVGDQGFIYVADSALATEADLSLLGDDIRFITRLPENFGVCRKLIDRSVVSGDWQDVGRLSHRRVKGKEVCASYRLREETVVLYGRTYRAVVVHSDAHDRRRQKRIDNAVKKDSEMVRAEATALSRKEFFCLPDAQTAAAALKDGDFHRIFCSFESRPVYGRGRPCKNGNRHVQGIRHRVLATVSENQAAVEKLREEAGCFVLLTNVPVEEKKGLEILRIYKEQDGIERNFGFLKDPLVANDVFLKKPHRIEAMGLVLVLSLLLWRLMERTMRKKIKNENIMLPGWNNRDTVRPTSFMMVSKFSPVFVGVKGDRRFLFTPLDQVQLAYLSALDVPPSIFTKINAPPTGTSRAGYH
jgi:transposase